MEMAANLLFESLMQQGDIRSMYEFLINLKNIDDFIYNDSETETNALHIACSTDSPIRDQVVILLVRLNANINTPAKVDNTSNMTALHLATINGFHSTIEILLNLGADVDLYDSSKLTPYCYATRFNSESTYLLGCFKRDFPSSLKTIDLKLNKTKTNIDISTTTNDIDNSRSTDTGSARREPNDRADYENDYDHYNFRDENDTNEFTAVSGKSSLTSPTKPNNFVSSSSIKEFSKIKWKKKIYYGYLIEERQYDCHYHEQQNKSGEDL